MFFKNLNTPLNDFDSRNVLIFGASSGIGLALALSLLKRNANVFVSARRGNLLIQKFTKDNVLQADINDKDDVIRIFSEIKKRNIEIDTVFWCPGIYSPMRFENFDVEEAERIISTNLTSIFFPFSLMLDYWKKNKKNFKTRSVHWIWVSSVAGYRGLPGSVAYGPTKAAMNNLAEASYIELKPNNINITLVCPGFVETRLTKKNNFHMPAIISPSEASEYILKGLSKGKFEIHFPYKFTFFLKILSLLPRRIYFKLIRLID